jgi:cytochrome b subunit of formate dehydrogenase/nitrate/TMAO reductase-like tetraheme cytochrome c subunit
LSTGLLRNGARSRREIVVKTESILGLRGAGAGIRLVASCLAVVLLAGAWITPVFAQDADAPRAIPNERCLGCHDDDELKADDGRSMAVHEAEFAASKHRRLDCTTCHSDALTVRHPRENLGPVPTANCDQCHAEELEPLRASAHAKRAAPDADAGNCADCHGNIHYLPRRPGLEAPLSPVNQMQTCGQCHGEMMEGYLHSSHAKARLVKGLISSPACTDCHGGHGILPKDNPESRTSRQHSPETCGACHEFILSTWTESTHGQLWKEGKEGGPVCIDCHEAHDIVDPTTIQARQDFPDECGNCHEKESKTFHESFHGKATGIGRAGAAMCSDCHTPHHNLPTSDPRSTTHPDNLEAMCGKCHQGEITPAFLTFDPHNDPTDPDDNVYVYWVYVFMVSLLIGVFAFFGLHDLLWLQRALVGRLRGEYKSEHGGPGKYVKRFSRGQIAIHISIVLSFLLLAATGLPLKFASAPWAEPVANLLGGAEVVAWLHRFAAVVTFGYFAAHLGMLIWGMFVKREKGYLWGWRSMVPQLKDLQDFIANMKYFLYFGPRPKFDRWAYWEKFDYLAVFWGVAIIGFSGLFLWFPNFWTAFLPGWVLNAAYVVHSDEALLATGFIFLFHFFHTHLRPESFPMDPVVFIGKMPLEKFKEERPLEYERAVKDGTLESMLVDGPTREHLVEAYVFGFIAVAIGIGLAIAIFVGLLGSLH